MNDQPRGFEVEEVGAARPVPKAPPLRSLADSEVEGRHPDYLEGFLNPPAAAANPAEAPGGDLYEAVIARLRGIYDPEIPVNIYDLGLIYGVEIVSGHCTVTMTLTTPHCPVAETMPGEVETHVLAVPGIATADINLVWDPAWDPSKMSDEAKLEMGML